MEKNLRRRLGRSRRTICRFRFYRNAGCAFRREISGIYSERRLQRTRPRRNAVNSVARLLQHGWLFHPGPLSRKTRAGRSACGENVFAVYGGPCAHGIQSQRKNRVYRAGSFVRKNFRTGEAGERVALERAFRLFRATGSEGQTHRAVKQCQRT